MYFLLLQFLGFYLRILKPQVKPQTIFNVHLKNVLIGKVGIEPTNNSSLLIFNTFKELLFVSY